MTTTTYTFQVITNNEDRVVSVSAIQATVDPETVTDDGIAKAMSKTAACGAARRIGIEARSVLDNIVRTGYPARKTLTPTERAEKYARLLAEAKAEAKAAAAK